MQNLFLNEAKKIWTEIAKKKTPGELRLEVELYKRMLNIFQVGDYYYFIFNPPEMLIEYTSQSMPDVLGHAEKDLNFEFLFDSIHPDDLPYFLDFEATVTDFFLHLPPEKVMKYKSRYNFRVRKSNGEYIHILQQTVALQSDEDGAVLRTFVVHTDITHLKKDNKMALSIIGLDGEPSYINISHKAKFTSADEVLSKREKEIVAYMINGFTSEQIADELNISYYTVSTHRKNIYKKTKTKSISELITKGLEKGWI